MTIEAVKDKLDDIRQRFQDIETYVSQVKQEFKAIIKDKSIPLADRWELFHNAPAGLRDQDVYIWRPKALESLGRHCWEDLAWPERYQEIDLVDIISDRIDFREPENAEVDERVTVEILIALAEEMLELNIESFTYDW